MQKFRLQIDNRYWSLSKLKYWIIGTNLLWVNLLYVSLYYLTLVRIHFVTKPRQSVILTAGVA